MLDIFADLNLGLFLAAASVLAFAPGPGMMYVLSRSIAGGTAAGVVSTLGTFCGGMMHVFAAAFGLSTLLATSATLFAILKWVGALFLIYLGLKSLFSIRLRSAPALSLASPAAQKLRPVFIQGVFAEMLNPKTAIFFLAFIPQFVSPQHGHVFMQFTTLGLIVVTLNMVPDILIACMAGPAAKYWLRVAPLRTAQQVFSGACLIGLGAYLASGDGPADMGRS